MPPGPTNRVGSQAAHHELVQIEVEVQAVGGRQDVARHVLRKARVHGTRLPPATL
jgi:hypothetical protein